MQRVVHSFKADNNIESQEVVYAKTALHGLYAHPEGLEPPVVQPSAQLVRAEPMPLEQEPLSLVKQPVLLINKDVYNELNIDMLLGNVSRTYTLTTDAKECTHFIVGKLAKTELFLCCLAGGKWIVAPSFLTASSERGNFVQEAAHEWNVERVKQTCLRSSTLLLGEACHRQRRASERPFTQWDVILTCSGPARTAGFHRVLESGGCKSIAHCTSKEVLEKAQSGELQSHHPDTTLHILSDDNMWSESDMEQLAEWCKAPVLRLEYMVHFMSVENPNPAEYELLQNVRSKKRSRTASR
ncbi:topoisomerase (DNA) II binding protein 1 [Angomonas deanei]|uniref:BRCT domain-containing protein n=1 Tax=Angomonas deanei TaxID=59799 RepID=A0A7G2CJX3_9TRYP|nr:topoisomerase (DNA) II binding protein 1 [Angomonas deanei]CAD2218562.1 hypothetical protein, conserved [Angomonas deanei]|eukprot:EPY32486.1 topoisomerase (DNA) II binding protein 1 [Angomonas deanei]